MTTTGNLLAARGEGIYVLLALRQVRVGAGECVEGTTTSPLSGRVIQQSFTRAIAPVSPLLGVSRATVL